LIFSGIFIFQFIFIINWHLGLSNTLYMKSTGYLPFSYKFHGNSAIPSSSWTIAKCSCKAFQAANLGPNKSLLNVHSAYRSSKLLQ
jgi:hypothetical protein